MRLQTIVFALLFSAGCSTATPFESEQAALVGAHLRAARGVTHYAGDPTRLMGAGVGADQVAQQGSEFDAGPEVHCVRTSDVDTAFGSEHTASCNDGELDMTLSLSDEGGRHRAELHLDGLFEGTIATSTTTFDLADDPDHIDGSFDEEIRIRLGGERSDRHTHYAFEGVLLDPTGCPVFGGVKVEREETGHDDLSARYTVGPACNEVHLHPALAGW